MERHTKNYYEYFGYDASSFIGCEVCGAPASSIHHVIPRSKFGKKRKEEQDDITNLIALCFLHHDMVHARDGGNELNEQIKEIIYERHRKTTT